MVTRSPWTTLCVALFVIVAILAVCVPASGLGSLSSSLSSPTPSFVVVVIAPRPHRSPSFSPLLSSSPDSNDSMIVIMIVIMIVMMIVMIVMI